MQKQLSYRKIRCFVRVAMFKKRSDAMKKYIFVVHIFLPKFPEKAMENRAKNMQNRLAHKNRQTSTFRTPFFQQKLDVWLISGVSLGPREPPGTSREPPRIVYFFHDFSVASENGPGGLPGGPRVPAGTPRGPFWVDFEWILHIKKHPNNATKC